MSSCYPTLRSLNLPHYNPQKKNHPKNKPISPLTDPVKNRQITILVETPVFWAIQILHFFGEENLENIYFCLCPRCQNVSSMWQHKLGDGNIRHQVYRQLMRILIILIRMKEASSKFQKEVTLGDSSLQAMPHWNIGRIELWWFI